MEFDWDLNQQNRKTLIFILFLLASWAIGNAMNLMDYSGGTSNMAWSLNPAYYTIFLFILTGIMIFKHRSSTGFLSAIGIIVALNIMAAFLLYFQLNLFLIGGIVGTALILVFLHSSNLGKKGKLYFGLMALTSLGLFAYFFFGEYELIDLFDKSGSGGEAPSILPWGEASEVMNSTIEGSGYIILLIISVIALALFLYQRQELFSSSPEEKEKKELEEDISSTVDRAISDLSEGKDVESTIRRCYFQMCLLLEEKGAKNEEFMTPREFEKYALAKLSVSSSKLSEIRSLFEKVKYSAHEFDESHREIAVKNLKELKKELG